MELLACALLLYLTVASVSSDSVYFHDTWAGTEVSITGMVHGENIVKNTTNLLDQLLNGYDRRLRPGFGGPPDIIDVNLNIRSMGPISEREMAYQMDCYFRQSWQDKRLAFTGPIKTLVVGVNILELMWKPDTHFFNGQRSYLHTVTTPNKLLRIRQDGRILYSMRLTIKASCPMHLEKFPMDTQTCPIRFGSHGYDETDILYIWTHGVNSSIKMATDMRLSQFDLIAYPAGFDFMNDSSGRNHIARHGATYSKQSLRYSVLYADFILRRHMGYFMINVYVPSSLLVVISWVGFWINREATADRIALGITTVLTMAFLGIDNRDDLPKVSYSTALDYFVAVSFAFVLATVIQFAGVHFFTKHGSGEDMPEYTSDEEEEASADERAQPRRNGTHRQDSMVISSKANGNARVSLTYSSCTVKRPHESCCVKFYYCVRGSAHYRDMKARSTPIGVNSVSKIDKASRFLFPMSFLAFNIFYWAWYLENEYDRPIYF